MAKIKCKVNEDLTIVLDNVQKTHGHDDSLPFQADIYVKSEKLGFPKLTRVGYAFNDGWGGDTIIKSASHQHILNTINGILMNNYQIHIKRHEITWAVRLEYLVSIMAERSIYGHKTKMDIMDMEDCEKIEPLQYPKANGQKYTYAKCLIQLPLDSEEILVALAPRENLGIEKGSEVDKTIFHYFNGYEELLEQLTKQPVFTSADDFNIKSIIELI